MKPIRVLLIVPPVRLQRQEFEYLVHWPRHAIVLAAELGEEYQVEILDITAEFHADPPHVYEPQASTGQDHPADLHTTLARVVQGRVREFQPDVIAVHAHAAPHLPVVAKVFGALLPVAGRAQIVVGGMAASHLTDVVANLCPPGSWIVRGEATGRIRDTFELILGRRAPVPAKESIQTFHAKHRSPTSLPVLGMDTSTSGTAEVRILLIEQNPRVMDYLMPRFDLLPMPIYQRLYASGAFVPHLEMTSGCTFRCAFCGVHYPSAEGRFRTRPLERVIEELAHLRDRYGFHDFYFCDETFTLHRPLAKAFCESVRERLPGIRWRCVTRVDKVDDELVELMAQAGCYEIGFGVESGNDALLGEVDKRATVGRNRDAIALVQSYGIAANALTIIGHPAEDHRHLRETFEFLARDARPQRCQVFIFHPVPGTEYFAHPERYGLQINIQRIEDWYRFDHIGEAVCDTPYLSRADIARYYMLFNRALATIVDPEPDEALISRVLSNRFPVRRKGVTWLREGGRLRLYRPVDPSGSILENTLVIDAGDSPYEGDGGARQAEIVEFVLTQCTGMRTRSEIAADASKLFLASAAAAQEWADAALGLLMEAGVVTEF